MNMPKSHWRFVNRANPNETIAVLDFESAKTLARILQNAAAPGQWFLQEEVAIESLDSALAAAPAVPEQKKSPEQPPERSAIPQRPPMRAEAAPPPAPVGDSLAPEASEPPRFEEEERLPPPVFATERRAGKRRYDRFKVEFRVIMVSGGKSFRSFSSDVSVGGMLLKQKIPPSMLNQVCTVFIGSKTGPENIELKCKIVGDPANPSRIAFVDCDVPTLRRLENWVLQSKQQGGQEVRAA